MISQDGVEENTMSANRIRTCIRIDKVSTLIILVLRWWAQTESTSYALPRNSDLDTITGWLHRKGGD